jgi:hypothetical protein
MREADVVWPGKFANQGLDVDGAVSVSVVVSGSPV